MTYYWETFAKKIFIRQFTISIIYMILFTISSTLYTYNSIYFKDYYLYSSHHQNKTYNYSIINTTNTNITNNTTYIDFDKKTIIIYSNQFTLVLIVLF